MEAGYDILPWFGISDSQFYLFARYEYYDSYIPAADQQDYPYTDRQRIAAGFNWFPIPEIAIKGEYSHRFLKEPYNNEPSISLGVTYMAFFKR
jgi:long-subunit fatty acid transport protein